MLAHRPFLYRQFTVKQHKQLNDISKVVLQSDRGDHIDMTVAKVSISVGDILDFVFFDTVLNYTVPYAVDSITAGDDGVRRVKFFRGSNTSGDISHDPGENILILPETVYNRSRLRPGFMFSVLPMWNLSAIRG